MDAIRRQLELASKDIIHALRCYALFVTFIRSEDVRQAAHDIGAPLVRDTVLLSLLRETLLAVSRIWDRGGGRVSLDQLITALPKHAPTLRHIRLMETKRAADVAGPRVYLTGDEGDVDVKTLASRAFAQRQIEAGAREAAKVDTYLRELETLTSRHQKVRDNIRDIRSKALAHTSFAEVGGTLRYRDLCTVLLGTARIIERVTWLVEYRRADLNHFAREALDDAKRVVDALSGRPKPLEDF